MSVISTFILLTLVGGAPQAESPDLTLLGKRLWSIDARKGVTALNKNADLLLQATKRSDRLTVSSGNEATSFAEVMAYCRKNQALVKEIVNRYLFTVGSPGDRRETPPLIDPRHVTEKYRLVWEFVLLLPQSSSFVDGYLQRANVALQRIANPASAETIAYLMQLRAREMRNPPAFLTTARMKTVFLGKSKSDQLSLATILNGTKSQAALQRLASSVGTLDALADKDARDAHLGALAKEFMRGLDEETAEYWRNASSSLLRANHSMPQVSREFLQALVGQVSG